MRRVMLSIICVCFALAAFAGSAAAQTFPYDHIHVNVPDPAAAANWYEKYFGGRRITEAPDRLMFGSTRFLFLKKADAKPSAGSAIDHVGFSFPDLDAKIEGIRSGGHQDRHAGARCARTLQARFRGRSVGHAHRSRAGSGTCSGCTTSICADRIRMRFSPGCWRSSADERTKLKGRLDAHQVQRARLQRYVDPGAERRRGAERGPRYRPHRLALRRARWRRPSTVCAPKA